MGKKTTAFLLLGAAALLGGCESARKVFSTEKTAPDEFAVYSRPPLSVPPEFKLRPPTPGDSRTRDLNASKIAEHAMKGRSAAGTPAQQGNGSKGVNALLRDTGALHASSDIRAVINEETSIISQRDQAFVDKLIFWVDEKPYPGSVVDAKKEQKRIQENLALGKPITEGETPKITKKRGRKGLLNF